MLGAPKLSPTHHIALTADDLSVMVRAMTAHKERGADMETSGLRYKNGAAPIGYSVGFLDGDVVPHAWYVPFDHQTAERQCDPDQARKAWHDAMGEAEVVIGHNLKFDLNMGRAHGLAFPEGAQLHDSMIQAHLVYERRRMKLEYLAEDVVEYLPWDDAWEMERHVGNFLRRRAKDHRMTYKRSNKRTGVKSYMDTYGHAEVPIQLEGEYSCRDIGHSLMLERVQRDKAMGIGMPWQRQGEYLYQNEMMLVRALAEMEWHGQLVDREALLRLDVEVDDRLGRMGKELTAAFKTRITWRNDNDVRELLFNRMGLPVINRTDSGLPAVDRSALLQLQKHHHGIELLSEFNVWLKVWQTYTVGLAWYVDADGRIHPNFNQLGTKTGRLSGNNPNFQNIPTRHKEASRRIRTAFYVGEGMARVYADYSQVELRVLGHTAGATNLLSAYSSPAYEAMLRGAIDYATYRQVRKKEPSTDVHGAQAQATFGANPSDANWKSLRRAAKIINFGVPYGMGPHGLTANPDLLLDRDVAEDYFNKYHIANPEINVCKQALFAKMLKQPIPHFVNWAGRTCHSRELRAGNEKVRSAGERSTFATLVQGSAGELTRFSMVGLYKAQRAGRIPAVATSTVHDEIQMDCAAKDVMEVGLTTQREMENFAGLFGNVPIIADLEKTTTNWADKEDMPT